MIVLQGISRSYSVGDTTVNALAGVNLEVGAGEFVAVMGQSGSGKTTMMNIIGLLDRPSSGQYFFSGHDVSRISENARARLRGSAFGFVFQSYNLLPRLTALEQVEAPLVYQGIRNRRRRAAEALARVGLLERIYHRPTELSGGEQQRVTIARSLVSNPHVLLADEPTGALDTATGHDIMELLKELVEQEGLTIVLVTHEPDVAACARRLIRMRDGRVIEDSGVAMPSGAGSAPGASCGGNTGGPGRIYAMSLLDTVGIALRAILANRLRSALTSLGLIIGVSSVIVLIAIGQGTQKGVTDRIQGLGTDLIFIESSAAATTSQGGGIAGAASSTLVHSDAAAIAAGGIPGISAVAARFAVDAQAIAGGNNVGVEVVSTSSEYSEVRDLALSYGTFITPLHDEDRSLVAVLGARVADTLFPNLDPVGQEARLSFAGGRITLGFVVIGVLEEQGAASEADDQVFVPISAIAGRMRFLYTPGGDLRVSQIDVQLTDGADGEQAKEQVSELLLFLHDVPEPDFVIQSQGRPHQRRHRGEQHPVYPAGQHRRDLAGGRRHRRDEHYAGLGHGAHPRNRHPPRRGRHQPRHRDAVRDGGAVALRLRRHRGHRPRHRLCACRQRTGVGRTGNGDADPAVEHRRRLLRRCRRGLRQRQLSGIPRHRHRPGGRPPQRVTRPRRPSAAPAGGVT